MQRQCSIYIGQQSLSVELGDEAIELQLQLLHSLTKWALRYPMILVMGFNGTSTYILTSNIKLASFVQTLRTQPLKDGD
jgi:hypothetical protein